MRNDAICRPKQYEHGNYTNYRNSKTPKNTKHTNENIRETKQPNKQIAPRIEIDLIESSYRRGQLKHACMLEPVIRDSS